MMIALSVYYFILVAYAFLFSDVLLRFVVYCHSIVVVATCNAPSLSLSSDAESVTNHRNMIETSTRVAFITRSCRVPAKSTLP